ncbi:MAG: M13 family metallopeptidase [Acidobacteria bacterium]|nr:M13 family metallopeptidase [Acidobacteriota bacterium]
MKKQTSMAYRGLALALLLCLTALSPLARFSKQSGRGVDLSYMDTTIKPCQDFYQYANGNWLANNPIPADRSSWGAGSELYEKNQTVLHEILEEAARNTSAPKGSAARKVADFYRTGMDEAKIEAAGAKPLADEFARINAVKDATTLQAELAHLHRININPAFSPSAYQDFKDSSRIITWLYQDGIGLPDRDYYFKDDDKSKELRQAYVAYIGKMFELLGDKPEQAAAEARTVMALETRLAKAQMGAVELRNPQAIYHMMDVAALDKLAPSISWSRYFAAIGLSNPGDINVGQPELLKEVSAMVKDVPVADWQTYLRWAVVNSTAPYLSSAFVNESFNFYGKALSGQKEQKPRWKRVEGTTDSMLGEALGELYVARAFTPETKARAQAMVMNIKSALRDRITQLDWIGEDTRKQALRKVDAIKIKVGYPDKWRDYSALMIDQSSYVQNVLRAREFEIQRNFNKIGKPIDRNEWGMTPPTVDAYYNPNFNEIVFPAGILQPPFFDPNADDATNYGGIGSVIGHELTHGFDDQGHQFDADGNLKSWWTESDERNYASRGALVEAQYNDYVGVETLHVNGKLTLGENIADIGGLKIAYYAFQKSLEGKPRPASIDGFTPEQRFFLAFAQNWRRNTQPEALRLLIQTDPHSPTRFRVLGSVSNLPEFAKAFGCQPSDPLVRSEKDQARIW